MSGEADDAVGPRAVGDRGGRGGRWGGAGTRPPEPSPAGACRCADARPSSRLGALTRGGRDCSHGVRRREGGAVAGVRRHSASTPRVCAIAAWRSHHEAMPRQGRSAPEIPSAPRRRWPSPTSSLVPGRARRPHAVQSARHGDARSIELRFQEGIAPVRLVSRTSGRSSRTAPGRSGPAASAAPSLARACAPDRLGGRSPPPPPKTAWVGGRCPTPRRPAAGPPGRRSRGGQYCLPRRSRRRPPAPTLTAAQSTDAPSEKHGPGDRFRRDPSPAVHSQRRLLNGTCSSAPRGYEAPQRHG